MTATVSVDNDVFSIEALSKTIYTSVGSMSDSEILYLRSMLCVSGENIFKIYGGAAKLLGHGKAALILEHLQCLQEQCIDERVFFQVHLEFARLIHLHVATILKKHQPPTTPPLPSVQAIEELAVEHESFGFGQVNAKGYTTHGFDPENLHTFATALIDLRDKQWLG